MAQWIDSLLSDIIYHRFYNTYILQYQQFVLIDMFIWKNVSVQTTSVYGLPINKNGKSFRISDSGHHKHRPPHHPKAAKGVRLLRVVGDVAKSNCHLPWRRSAIQLSEEVEWRRMTLYFVGVGAANIVSRPSPQRAVGDGRPTTRTVPRARPPPPPPQSYEVVDAAADDGVDVAIGGATVETAADCTWRRPWSPTTMRLGPLWPHRRRFCASYETSAGDCCTPGGAWPGGWPCTFARWNCSTTIRQPPENVCPRSRHFYRNNKIIIYIYI